MGSVARFRSRLPRRSHDSSGDRDPVGEVASSHPVDAPLSGLHGISRVIVGIALLAVSVGAVAMSYGYGFGELSRPRAGAFPGLVALGIGAVSLLLIVQGLVERRQWGGESIGLRLNAIGQYRTAAIGLLLVAYPVGLYTIGFTVTSCLVAFGIATLLQAPMSTKGRAAFAVIVVLAVELLMTVIFDARFPGGLLGLLT